MRRTLLIFPTLALLGAAGAQTFPQVPSRGTVYDGAHLLSAGQADSLSALSRAFERDTGAPIVVATLPSLDALGAKSMGIDRYATALFDKWRIGNEAKDGGVLLVVAVADHKARIELGKAWAHRYDAKAHAIMQRTILPAFKDGDFGGGIVRGCQSLAHLADESPASNVLETIPPSAMLTGGRSEAVESPSGGLDGGVVVGFVLCCLAVPVLIAVAIVRAVRRAGGMASPTRGFPGTNRRGTAYTQDGRDDDAYAAGFIAGNMASPPIYDPAPTYDPSPTYDSSPGFDSGSSDDSGGSFDSGSSGGGGDTGSW